jgi:hypothetical protein
MMFRSAFLFAAAAAIAAPANAAPDGKTQSPPTEKAESSQKIVCKSVDTTGSRLSRSRDCKTRAQWEAEAQAVGEDLERQLNSRATGEATNLPH